jgi:hypothetical protein
MTTVITCLMKACCPPVPHLAPPPGLNSYSWGQLLQEITPHWSASTSPKLSKLSVIWEGENTLKKKRCTNSQFCAQNLRLLGLPQSEEFGTLEQNAHAILDCVEHPFLRPIHLQLTVDPLTKQQWCGTMVHSGGRTDSLRLPLIDQPQPFRRGW